MAIDPKTGKYIPAGIESLLPEYQAQYYALEPEIERTVREASNARGTYYSGEAITEESRAKEQLLASLASQSANANQSAKESEKERSASAERATSEGKAGMISAGLNAGLGAAGMMGAYKLMGAGNRFVPVTSADGQIQLIDTKSQTNLTTGESLVKGGPATATPTPAMGWGSSSMGKSTGFGNLALGAGGGVLGSAAGKAAFGGGGLSDLLSAAGGGAGYYWGAPALQAAGASPWLAVPAAAGLGAFGGRGLSSLLKQIGIA